MKRSAFYMLAVFLLVVAMFSWLWRSGSGISRSDVPATTSVVPPLSSRSVPARAGLRDAEENEATHPNRDSEEVLRENTVDSERSGSSEEAAQPAIAKALNDIRTMCETGRALQNVPRLTPQELIATILAHGDFAIESLTAAAIDPTQNAQYRAIAIRMLARIHDPSSIEVLTELANDPALDEVIRLAAVQALGTYVDTGVAKTLSELTRQEMASVGGSPSIVNNCLSALASMGSSGAVDLLIEGLSSTDCVTKVVALKGLAALAIDPENSECIDAIAALENAVSEVVTEGSIDSQDALAAQTQSAQSEAIRALARSGSGHATELIGSVVLSAESVSVRVVAVDSLACFEGNSVAAAVLTQAIKDESQQIQLHSLHALLEVAGEDAIPVLEETMGVSENVAVLDECRRAIERFNRRKEGQE